MKKIALVGLPGSGKTTVAKTLSKKFRWNWIDVDAEIERRNGMKISTFIREEGEQKFREIESRVISAILSESGLSKSGLADRVDGPKANTGVNLVFSLGGGALLSSANVSELKKHSVKIVCLEASYETLLERTRSDEIKAQKAGVGLQRPLLASEGLGSLEDRLKKLIAERKDIYKVADVFVTTDGKTELEVCEKINTLI